VVKGRGSEEEAGPWSDIGAMTIWFGSMEGWEEVIRPKRRKVSRRGACIVEESVDSGLQILECQKWPRELNCSHVTSCFAFGGLSAERKGVIGVAEVACRADVIILRCMKVDVPILLS
jgi:hypothetical protein